MGFFKEGNITGVSTKVKGIKNNIQDYLKLFTALQMKQQKQVRNEEFETIFTKQDISHDT